MMEVDWMAKPNYAFEKRQRELAKKQKKEAKLQKKSGADVPPELAPSKSPPKTP